MKKNLKTTYIPAYLLIAIVFFSCNKPKNAISPLNTNINQPCCIAIDKLGNIYFTNSQNENVLRVNTNGKLTEVAGTNTVLGCNGDGGSALLAHLYLPVGIAINASNNVYFSDFGCARVHEIVESSGYMYAIAGNGNRGYSGDGGQATSANIDVNGIALDTLGNLYIADLANNRIREVNLSSGIITTIAGNGTQGFSGDGGLATSAELNFPTYVALDDSNNVFICDYGNYRIRKINAITHIITTVAGTGVSGYNGDNILATSAQIEPAGIALDKNRNIYFCDSNSVRKINAQTGIVTTVVGNRTNGGYSGDGSLSISAELYNPSDIAFNPSFTDLYIVDPRNDAIRKVDIATGIISTVVSNYEIP